MTAPLRAFAAVLLAFWLVGCAGYHLGPTNGTVAGNRSVEVALFVNRTLEPRLSEPLAHALRKRLQQEGTFKLDTHGNADVIVTGELVKYERVPLSFRRNDIVTTRDYEVKLTAHVTALERGSGKVILEREVIGHSTVQDNADLPSVERQAAPLITDNLARQIADLLVDGAW